MTIVDFATAEEAVIYLKTLRGSIDTRALPVMMMIGSGSQDDGRHQVIWCHYKHDGGLTIACALYEGPHAHMIARFNINTQR